MKDPGRSATNSVKELKLCNRHHLVGDCNAPKCTHSHNGKLSASEMMALKFIARLRPCYNKLGCTDPECCEGHQCMSGSKCRKEDCWFAAEMHGVDMSNPKWEPVDETVWTKV